jgi:UDP-glucose 4-epimerase
MRVKDARQTFLGIWIRNLLEEKPIEVWGGFQRRDYSYVDDTVDAFLCAGASSLTDGHVYNVGGGEVITLAETAQLMLRVLGRGRIVTRDFPEDRAKIDIGDYFSDDSLFRGTVHWRPTVSLDTGVRETLCFYQRNLSHYI